MTLTTPNHDVQAASVVAYLDFLQVLPPGFRPHCRPRIRPSYRPSAGRPGLAPGADGISSRPAEQNLALSRRVRGREIRRDFSRYGVPPLLPQADSHLNQQVMRREHGAE